MYTFYTPKLNLITFVLFFFFFFSGPTKQTSSEGDGTMETTPSDTAALPTASSASALDTV